MANETVSFDVEKRDSRGVGFAEYIWAVAPARRRGRAGELLRAALKRCLDIGGASAGLVLLFPLFVAIAVAVRATSRGPVLFRQQRTGRNGVPFVMLKFRSMHADSCDADGVRQAVRGDPRVTAVGAFLRRTSFDELPQLINVLRGDMSLVGPRPHVPGMLAAGLPYEVFDGRYPERHAVLPGLTGLAQVMGYRGETRQVHAAQMRLEYDLAYIRHQSLLLDLRILAATVNREFFRGGGY